jgi:hypothetical protein
MKNKKPILIIISVIIISLGFIVQRFSNKKLIKVDNSNYKIANTSKEPFNPNKEYKTEECMIGGLCIASQNNNDYIVYNGKGVGPFDNINFLNQNSVSFLENGKMFY